MEILLVLCLFWRLCRSLRRYRSVIVSNGVPMLLYCCYQFLNPSSYVYFYKRTWESLGHTIHTSHWNQVPCWYQPHKKQRIYSIYGQLYRLFHPFAYTGHSNHDQIWLLLVFMFLWGLLDRLTNRYLSVAIGKTLFFMVMCPIIL